LTKGFDVLTELRTGAVIDSVRVMQSESEL
jgi:hypothetical protein